MLKGGKSGPAIVPGKPRKVCSYRRIRAGEMPPPKRLLEAGVTPMTAAEIDRLRDGLPRARRKDAASRTCAGIEPDPLVTAKDRQFWSFAHPP